MTMTAETETAIANINIGGVKINAEQELYVIPSYHRGKVSGYSCLGFDYLLQSANSVADWLISEGQQATRIPAKSFLASRPHYGRVWALTPGPRTAAVNRGGLTGRKKRPVSRSS